MEKERSLGSFHCCRNELQGIEMKVKQSQVLFKYTSREEWASQERQSPLEIPGCGHSLGGVGPRVATSEGQSWIM